MIPTPPPQRKEPLAQRLLLELKGPVRLGHTQQSFDRGVEQILAALDAAEQRGWDNAAQYIDKHGWNACAKAIRQRRRKEEAR